jgi:hypothetical protein
MYLLIRRILCTYFTENVFNVLREDIHLVEPAELVHGYAVFFVLIRDGIADRHQVVYVEKMTFNKRPSTLGAFF